MSDEVLNETCERLDGRMITTGNDRFGQSFEKRRPQDREGVWIYQTIMDRETGQVVQFLWSEEKILEFVKELVEMIKR